MFQWSESDQCCYEWKRSQPDLAIFDKTFLTIVNRHAPLKKKIVRENQAPFMTKELQKAISTRSRLKNKINKNPTEKNITVCLTKKKKQKCFSQ